MTAAPEASTTLDGRGLRVFDSDGHRIYWPDVDVTRDHARSGKTHGICTAGDTWDQDRATSPNARPGRLRLRERKAELGTVAGHINGTWYFDPATGTAEYRLVIWCAGCAGGENEHRPAGLPEAWRGQHVGTYLVEQVLPWLEQAGWTVSGRLECPRHRHQREALEQAIAELRSLDIQEGRFASGSAH